MLQIQQLKLPIDHSPEDLLKKAAKKLSLQPKDLQQFTVTKKSLDARKSLSSATAIPLRFRSRMNPRFCAEKKTEIYPPYSPFNTISHLPAPSPWVLARSSSERVPQGFSAGLCWLHTVTPRSFWSVENGWKNEYWTWRDIGKAAL